MNLTQLSTAELKSLFADIPAELKRRERTEKARIRKELEALAAQAGYSLDELLDESHTTTRKPRGSVAPKYRHPSDAALQWTGRGRQPRWVSEYLSHGGTIEQLAI
jgi:DNA-binding protein H-NS